MNRGSLHRASAAPAAFSAGAARPALQVPAQSCDCHMHIYDTRFPYVSTAQLRPPPATVGDYRSLQQRLGTTRVVVVQPSTYGTDNSCTLDAVAQFGNNARAIVVIDHNTSDAALREMDKQGARGIRLNLLRGATDYLSSLETLAARIAGLGWHLQLHTSGVTLAEIAPRLMRLPVPVVLDHMGRIPQPDGIGAPAFAAVRTLLDGGRTWVKLSGPYLDSSSSGPRYADMEPLARAYAQAAPERVIWGSDWPHPSASAGERPMPDDAELLDLLGNWAPTEVLRKRILVENPSRLYEFY